MKTTVELLLGYDIPFSELILKLHDIKIQPIKDSEIYKLKEDFEKTYGRSGTFSYYSGSKLIIDKYGEFPQFQEFEELLRNPILPSDLV